MFAVHNATKLAREYALTHNKPVVLEAMAYRVSHHSTSDDSTAYRSADEIEEWNTTAHPINKLKNYMISRGWWNATAEDQFTRDIRKQVLGQLASSEKKPKPDWRELFYDVYHDVPQHLQ